MGYEFSASLASNVIVANNDSVPFDNVTNLGRYDFSSGFYDITTGIYTVNTGYLAEIFGKIKVASLLATSQFQLKGLTSGNIYAVIDLPSLALGSTQDGDLPRLTLQLSFLDPTLEQIALINTSGSSRTVLADSYFGVIPLS